MLDLTAFNDALKDYYTDDDVVDETYQERPLLALMEKSEKFPGRKLPIPIVYGNPASRSASFAQAQTRAASVSTRVEAFDLVRVKDYGVVNIDTETMEASDVKDGAWMDARTTEIDGIINAVSNALCSGAYRAGWGSIGTVGSSTGATVTLGSVSDAANFERDLEVVFAQSESGHVLRDSGDSLIVSGVNRQTGVITFTTNVSNISGLSNGDHLFVKGDRENSATPSRLRVAGATAWCLTSAPSGGENFFAVDRSVDSRLWGNYYNAGSENIEDGLISGAHVVASMGFSIDHYGVSFAQHAKLTKNCHDLRRFVEVKATATIGFETFTIQGPKGLVKVFADQFAPANEAFGFQRKYFKLHSIGKAVRIIKDPDGRMYERLPTSDGIGVRVGFKGNIGCNAPASLIRVALPAA